MASKIALILDILCDGKWHKIGELQQKVKLTEHQTLEITTFLTQYDFVKMDQANLKVKIAKNAKEFLTQTAI